MGFYPKIDFRTSCLVDESPENKPVQVYYTLSLTGVPNTNTPTLAGVKTKHSLIQAGVQAVDKLIRCPEFDTLWQKSEAECSIFYFLIPSVVLAVDNSEETVETCLQTGVWRQVHRVVSRMILIILNSLVSHPPWRHRLVSNPRGAIA